MAKKILRYILTTIAIAAVVILVFSEKEAEEQYAPRDYDEILASGTLRAVTVYNAISFHVSADTIQGFDYELLRAFAHEKGIQLEMTPEASFEKRFKGITSGKYDLLATPTLVTSQLKDTLLLTNPIHLSKQVLVQRKLEKGKDSLFIKNQLDLAQKTLHMVKSSPALMRIHNLMAEIGDTIYVNEVSRYGAEQLLAMVAAGDIDYAVCDESLAKASLEDFSNLDIQTDISFTQFYAWGINQHSTSLLDSLNTWLHEYQECKAYKTLYNKYFH